MHLSSCRTIVRPLFAVVFAAVFAAHADAEVKPFPSSFHAEQMAVTGGTQYVRVGGQFAAFARDAEENQALFAKGGKLSMPILAIGGGHSYGAAMKTQLDAVASHVDGAVIADSGHWIMEEQPRQAVDVIVAYLEKK